MNKLATLKNGLMPDTRLVPRYAATVSAVAAEVCVNVVYVRMAAPETKLVETEVPENLRGVNKFIGTE